MAKIFSNLSPNQEMEEVVEKCDSTSLLESTGYEKIEKTVDRLMVAGMNLYDRNRNANFQGDDPDKLEADQPYMTKWNDEKDVKMRMREIMARLRRKVNREPAIETTNEPAAETAAEPAAEPAAETEVK